MRKFNHIQIESVAEAVSALRQYNGSARVIAGGTDLIGGLRDDIWPAQPEAIINLKTVPGLDHLTEADGELRIGALVTLTQIAESERVQNRYTALAEAAFRTASPLLRNLGTLAGNICQENRCWYYRYPEQLGGRIDCVRKGGGKCLAVAGDHRYHTIFGAVKKCIAVNPSDTAPALMVLNAGVKTSKRTIPIAEFFTASQGMKSTILDVDEIVTEIRIPAPKAGSKSAFNKHALRKTIDFPIVNCAVRIDMDGDSVADAAISLNAVHCNPMRAREAEETLCGRPLTDATAQAAAEAALATARPLIMNSYKVPIARTLLKDALMTCR